MPWKKKSVSRRPKKSYKPRAKRSVRRTMKAMNIATASETITGQLIGNTWTTFNDFSLSSFGRASSIAQDYQKYRITKLEFRIRPYADTYPVGGTGTIPYLYRMMDKSGTLPSTGGSLALLKNLGCKPTRFDDKTILVKYRPSVLVDTQATGGGGSLNSRPISAPWLSTNGAPDTATWSASRVPHYGVVMYLDAFGLASNPAVQVDVTAHFEFKMPNFVTQI